MHRVHEFPLWYCFVMQHIKCGNYYRSVSFPLFVLCLFKCIDEEDFCYNRKTSMFPFVYIMHYTPARLFPFQMFVKININSFKWHKCDECQFMKIFLWESSPFSQSSVAYTCPLKIMVRFSTVKWAWDVVDQRECYVVAPTIPFYNIHDRRDTWRFVCLLTTLE